VGREQGRSGGFLCQQSRCARLVTANATVPSQEPTLTVADLAGYPGPALVMVGDDEDEIPMEHILALRQGLPRSQLAVVPGAGHGLPVDKPELFNRLVVDFLTGDTDGGDR
jgi:pimeloyl-ACP methyl ester carboxylesterase